MVSQLFAQSFVQAPIKENIKAQRHWPLWVESTGDRWITLTKGPVTRKMFPFNGVIMNYHVFYHDVDEIFWPQPIRSLKLGHVTGQGSMFPTWMALVSDPGYGLHENIKTWMILLLRGFHRWPVNSPHKWPVTGKFFHFMTSSCKVKKIHK